MYISTHLYIALNKNIQTNSYILKFGIEFDTAKMTIYLMDPIKVYYS